MLDERETISHQMKRRVGSLIGRLNNGGRQPVSEHWMRYPAEPLQPSYYAQLLATAVSMTEEEQRARALMEPRETPRGKSDGREVGAPEVSIGIEGDWLGDAQQPQRASQVHDPLHDGPLIV